MLAFGLVMPAATYAFSIDEIIENAKTGGGIYTESHSSASTGGQTAASGQSVSTGDSSASSHVETRINADGSGGDVKVKIETSENGTVKTEEYSKPIEAGAGAKVEVNASVKNGESQSNVKVNDETIDAHAPLEAAGNLMGSTSAHVAVQTKIKTLFSIKLPNFFKKAFSFFWRF